MNGDQTVKKPARLGGTWVVRGNRVGDGILRGDDDVGYLLLLFVVVARNSRERRG